MVMKHGTVKLLIDGVYLDVKTCQFFLCLGVIVCVLYTVSGLFVVLLVLCFKSLVSFTGFYTEDEPTDGSLKCHLSTCSLTQS